MPGKSLAESIHYFKVTREPRVPIEAFSGVHETEPKTAFVSSNNQANFCVDLSAPMEVLEAQLVQQATVCHEALIEIAGLVSFGIRTRCSPQQSMYDPTLWQMVVSHIPLWDILDLSTDGSDTKTDLESELTNFFGRVVDAATGQKLVKLIGEHLKSMSLPVVNIFAFGVRTSLNVPEGIILPWIALFSYSSSKSKTCNQYFGNWGYPNASVDSQKKVFEILKTAKRDPVQEAPNYLTITVGA